MGLARTECSGFPPHPCTPAPGASAGRLAPARAGCVDLPRRPLLNPLPHRRALLGRALRNPNRPAEVPSVSMLLRSALFLSLLAAPAAHAAGANVTVRCPSACTVKLEGKEGRKQGDKAWAFGDVAAGGKRVEVLTPEGKTLAMGYATIPEGGGNVTVTLDANRNFSVSGGNGAKAAAAAPAAAPAQPQAKAKGSGKGNGALVVRCMDDCTVRVDGKAGVRQDARTWEFRDLEPGQRRVEAKGGLFNRPLFTGFADVAPGMKAKAQIDSSRRLTITESEPLRDEKAMKFAAGAPGQLQVRCPKHCTVTVNGVRKGAEASQLITVRDLAPGLYKVEAKFRLGTKVVRAEIPVQAGTEVFATATESGLSVTNTQALGKR